MPVPCINTISDRHSIVFSYVYEENNSNIKVFYKWTELLAAKNLQEIILKLVDCDLE